MTSLPFLLLAQCPPASEPQSIDQLVCPEDFGQIQKAILQRRFSTGTTLNTIPIANVSLRATWEALQQATNGTKVVWTNGLGDPQVTPGAPLEFGSGNQVPNGAPLNRGSEFTVANFMMYSYNQLVVQQMKCWKTEEATIFFINQDGIIAGEVDDLGTPTVFRGFPIQLNTMHVGDKQPGGYGQPDMNAFSFKLAPNWSDKWYQVTPEAAFDPLTGIYG